MTFDKHMDNERGKDRATMSRWEDECLFSRNRPTAPGEIPERPYMRTEAELEAAALEAMERANQHANTPRGRLCAALTDLAQCGIYEAETVRSIYSRDLADERRPVPTDAVVRAIRILNGVSLPVAREAIQALCDLADGGIESGSSRRAA